MSLDEWFLPKWVEFCLQSISEGTLTKSNILTSERGGVATPPTTAEP